MCDKCSKGEGIKYKLMEKKYMIAHIVVTLRHHPGLSPTPPTLDCLIHGRSIAKCRQTMIPLYPDSPMNATHNNIHKKRGSPSSLQEDHPQTNKQVFLGRYYVRLIEGQIKLRIR